MTAIILFGGAKIIKRISDWLRPLFQLFIIATLICLSFIINFVDVLASIIARVGYKAEDLPNWLRLAAAYGRIPLSAVIILAVLLWIRHKNKERILNSSNNIYHDHPFWSYLICSKILGYKKCRLIIT